jgi:serine/threonine-protein kinase
MQLVRRSLDQADAAPIAGSIDGTGPFFSPDGQWIAFATDARLVKVPIGGGTPVTIANVPGGALGAWIDADTILFSTNTGRVIQRVRAAGGTPEPVTHLEAGQHFHEGPTAWPGGGTALVTVAYDDGPKIGAIDLASGRVRPIVAGRQPRALGGGRMLFARGDALWTARVDAARAVVVDEPVQIQAGVELGALNGTAHFAASDDGTLVFIPRRPALDVKTPVWVARDGRAEALAVTPQPYTRAALSPDGSRLALALSTPEIRDVYVFERTRGALMRLTLDPATDTAPVWTPNGRSVAFRSERDGGGIFLTPADGSGGVQRLTRSDGPARPAHTPYTFTPDGGTLLFTELRSYSDQGINAVTVGPEPRVTVVLDGPFAEARPALSPDGKWLAYQSDESGRYEIYVRPYPAVDRARLQISTAGGSSARWSRDGREIFFSDGTSLIAVPVSVSVQAELVAGKPVRLFDASIFNERLGPLYDVAPDGRFVFLRPGGVGQAPQRRGDLRLLANWITSSTRSPD